MVSVCIGDYDLVVTGKALRSFNYQLLKAEIMHVLTHTHTHARTHTHTHSQPYGITSICSPARRIKCQPAQCGLYLFSLVECGCLNILFIHFSAVECYPVTDFRRLLNGKNQPSQNMLRQIRTADLLVDSIKYVLQTYWSFPSNTYLQT